MAKNSRRVSGNGFVSYDLTVGSGVSSGDVVLISEMPVWALEDADSSNNATAEIIGCMRVINDTVTGANNAGNSAVAVGDALYKDGSEINKDATNGTKIGYALGTVSSGGTDAIDIALVG